MPVNGGPFSCLPARSIELLPEHIACNDVTLPWEYNPHNTRLFVIGNEFGALGAVWANHEQDAFDELVDQGYGDGLLLDPKDVEAMTEDEREDVSFLGNASEPCDLTNAWIQQVRLDPGQDCKLLCAFAEARGAAHNNLDH